MKVLLFSNFCVETTISSTHVYLDHNTYFNLNYVTFLKQIPIGLYL